MELIRKTKSIKKYENYYIYYGIFLCSYCLKEVELILGNGLNQQSCGCQKSKLISESKIGKNNPMYGKRGELNPLYNKIHTKEHNNKISKGNTGKKRTEEQNKSISERMKGKKKTEEHKNKLSKIRIEKELSKGKNNPNYGNGIKITGDRHWNWNNGSSFEPYSPEFNKQKKQQILERDNYTCQCPDCEHKTDLLDVHHIDYDKKNNLDENLIILCRSCHAKTFGKNNRRFWINYYKTIIGDINVR